MLKTGIVSKKLSKNLFGSKRVFTLTNQPRLYNTTPEGVYKGELLLTSDLTIKLDSAKQFTMHYASCNKKYHMTTVGRQDASDWVNKLKDLQKKTTMEWQVKA